MATKKDPLFEQADSLWKMLDDLAETNPDGYKKLMDNVIKEQKEQWKPPEPVFCFRTIELPESSNRHVFINICKWDRVSKPKDEEDKISVTASNLRDIPDCSSKHSVMDLCFHDDVIKEVGNDAQCKKLIALLALDYVEKQTGLKLSKSYKVLSIKYKGNVDELKRFLFSHNFAGGSPAKPPEGTPTSQSESGSLLDRLSTIVQNDKHGKPNGIPKDFDGLPSETLLGKKEQKAPKKPLIQEVSIKQTKVKTPKQSVPRHNVEVVNANGVNPRSIVVKVELPEVQSGAECELDVSKHDLVLYTPKSSKLQVSLPEQGNEDDTTSTFNKTTRQLTIRIPVAKP